MSILVWCGGHVVVQICFTDVRKKKSSLLISTTQLGLSCTLIPAGINNWGFKSLSAKANPY
jgi:hypothetical protein